MTEHLTDALIRKLEPPEKGNTISYDGLAGFGLRTTAGGAKSFILNYRVRGSGRERRYTIGSFPNWGAVAARKRARELKRLIEAGGDPLGDLEDERAAPTMADLIERFRKEHLPKRRPATRDSYEGNIRNHIAPHFGPHLKVADVAFADIEALHRKVTESAGPYAANRCIALLSKLFSLAMRWRMRADNPCKGIELNTEYHRQRYMTAEELARLVAALAEHPEKQTADILRVILFTGCRKSEALAMRWADVDDTGKWSKPPSSTKQKKPHEVFLSAPMRQLLAEIADEQTGKGRRALGEFVFPSATSGAGHTVYIDGAWRSLCKTAMIKELRIHDLRHSFASQLVSGGASLPLIGAMLGHTKAETTKRYAHLFAEPQQQAAERVGAIYAAAGKPTEEPIELSTRRRGR
jgi:integrase